MIGTILGIVSDAILPTPVTIVKDLTIGNTVEDTLGDILDAFLDDED